MTTGWLTPTGIAPPREHLELGDHVRYHHCARAARRFYAEYTRVPYWQGVGPGRRTRFSWFLEEERDPLDIPTDGRRNKTVVMWPEEGSGIIIAMIRRGIGESVPGHGSGEDFDPGYFAADDWVWLYAIKTHLSSLDFVLAPVWATHKDVP